MKKIIDYLAQELAEEREERAKRVKLTPRQKLDYELYLRACRQTKTKPTLMGFLTMDIPWPVVDALGDLESEVWQKERKHTLAAAAGR